ncbi:hypothetical protein Hamer_G007047, partial [Homarus americanus]
DEEARLECTTRNRGWADPRHFNVRWLLHPADGYTYSFSTPIHRRGAAITIFNITKTLSVKCTMEEKKGLVWMPGDRDGDVAHTSATVHVLDPAGPLPCPDDLAYGVTWKTTMVDQKDVAPCPEGYNGEATTRFCRTHISGVWDSPNSSRVWDGTAPPSLLEDDTTHPSLFENGTNPSLSWGTTHSYPAWDIPDFSGCIYQPLLYIKTVRHTPC